MGDELEVALFEAKEVYVYRLPPRGTSAGYKAAEWPDSDLIWTGKIAVVERGRSCAVRLLVPDTGAVFAECPVQPGSVEPVLDSSRFFVLKIVDARSGRHAFLGMGFGERSESFDFSAALQDHQRRIDDEERYRKQREENALRPPVDRAIPSGQTISIQLKGAAPKQSSSSSSAASSVPLAAVPPGALLPPPPGSGRSRQTHSRQQQQKPTDTDNGWSDFT